ncbi:ABC transporter ATP-binding protein [Nocardioides sp. W7]|uniref:ABC transporter ATP-binding protein n=1 Tax=Nocardioides sp. W7 TaxID=2931390 RepID=UPI001FD54E48|nr:ABC transporter ATP-binding protein [Nocardioides sp. W7]
MTGRGEDLLRVESVTVAFGGLKAVNAVSLSAAAGTITGLIGPNGAGKTTLFNVVAGIQRPNQGRVSLGGRDVTAASPQRRARLGLARTFQRLEVFGTLSARENILVGAESRRRWDRSVRPQHVARQLSERLGLDDVGDVLVDNLPTGTQRLVELGRALATGPRLLLLDEAASGLDENETSAMADLLRELAADGLTIALVEHDMSFVMGLSDTVVMLDHGEVAAVGSPDEVRSSPAVQAAYLGTAEGGRR